MVDYSSKWNQYNRGEVKWINKHRQHICRSKYIDYVIENRQDIKSILEIGAGELIEAVELKRQIDDLNYTVADISDFFLRDCKRKKMFNCVKSSMINLPFKGNTFDLVYMTSVIEHSPDVYKTIEEVKRVSKSWYLTLFKWKMKSGNLKSEFRTVRNYFSTYFNLPQLIDLIENYGTITDMFVSTYQGKPYIKFDEYKKFVIKDNDICRNKDRLSILVDFVDG